MLYIFRFLHQTTTLYPYLPEIFSCISFVSYIKPQHQPKMQCRLRVVYLSFPTSNHNRPGLFCLGSGVVYLSFPTSNHNYAAACIAAILLYIFRFLHQTTTRHLVSHIQESCISFVSYIKPQLTSLGVGLHFVVYLSFPTSNHNYIGNNILSPYVVYLSFPTSNHNDNLEWDGNIVLYIFRFLHQTTTENR